MVSAPVESSPRDDLLNINNRFASLSKKWNYGFNQFLKSFHSCNDMLYHMYPTISVQGTQDVNYEEYWLIVESVHNLIGYSIEIWTQISKIPLFQHNLFQLAMNDSNNEILNIFCFFISSILLELSSFSVFNRIMTTGKQWEKENMEEMNEFRVIVRDFLREVSYPNFFSYLLSLSCHETKVFLEANISSPVVAGDRTCVNESLRTESALHAFSSICREKLNCIEDKKEIQQILVFWNDLLDVKCVENRLICRISVSLFSEFIRFCLDKEIIIFPTGVVSEEDLLSLFSRTFSCLCRSVSLHKEKFSKNQRYEFSQCLSFRLKQDHIGCVSFQKSCDTLFQYLILQVSSATTGDSRNSLHFSGRILSSVYSSLEGTSDVEAMLSTVINHFRSTSSHVSSSISSDSIIACTFIFAVQYLIQCNPSAEALNDLSLSLPSFSIFFHTFCRLSTFSFIPFSLVAPRHQQPQPFYCGNSYYWLLLSSSFIASLHLSSPTMSHENSSYHEMMNELSSFLSSEKILKNSNFQYEKNHNQEFLSMIFELSHLFTSHLSLHIVLSMIIEILHYVDIALANDINVRNCLLQNCDSEACSVLPMDSGAYVEVLHFLRLFLSLLLSPLSNESNTRTLTEFDLLDDICDFLSTFSIKLISSVHFHSLGQWLLCYAESLELVKLCLIYYGNYESLNIYKKKSIHSVFK
jgi:hypothetical protein